MFHCHLNFKYVSFFSFTIIRFIGHSDLKNHKRSIESADETHFLLLLWDEWGGSTLYSTSDIRILSVSLLDIDGV